MSTIDSHYWSIGYDLKRTYQRNFTIGSILVNGLLGITILICVFWPNNRADERIRLSGGCGAENSNPHLVTAWSKTYSSPPDGSIGRNERRFKIISDHGSVEQNRPQTSFTFSFTPPPDIDLLEEGFGPLSSGDGTGYGFGSGFDSGWYSGHDLPEPPSLIDLAESLYTKISALSDSDVVKELTERSKRKKIFLDPRRVDVLAYPVFPNNVSDSVIGKVVVEFIIVPRNSYWDGDSLKAYYLLYQSPEEYREAFVASVITSINQGGFRFRMARLNGIPTKVEDTVFFVCTILPSSVQWYGSLTNSDSLLLDSVLEQYRKNESNKIVR